LVLTGMADIEEVPSNGARKRPLRSDNRRIYNVDSTPVAASTRVSLVTTPEAPASAPVPPVIGP
jgi:hypothetical protein